MSSGLQGKGAVKTNISAMDAGVGLGAQNLESLLLDYISSRKDHLALEDLARFGCSSTRLLGDMPDQRSFFLLAYSTNRVRVFYHPSTSGR